MKMMLLKKIILIASLIILSTVITNSSLNLLSDNEFKMITDLDNNTIEIPVNPQRIACLHGPAYDRILMMGKAKCLALMPLKATPWALELFPEIRDIPIITSYIEVDIEQMLKYKIDLVYYAMHHAHADKLKAVGIRSARPFPVNKMPSDIYEFMEIYKNQIIFFGETLGADAKIKAKKYCEYFDKTFKRLLSITSKIPGNKRPLVYYGGLNGSLYDTQGKDAIMNWCVEAAGGKFATAGLKSYFAKISSEQLIAWNPEFIFIGMKGSMDYAKNNPVLKGIKAVKENTVYMIPVGVFWWDLSSCETVLLPLFIAKKIHPDLLKDWDIIQEMKIFYAEIYNKKISSKDAERILEALPPI